jgi:3-methyl-2-oxobutanoate hydroxymethyltransferase
MSAVPTGGAPRTVTTATFRARKLAHEPIVMVTAYDASQARLAEAGGVDAILVGDSVGMTVLGYDSTLPVTMDDMVRHTAAARRGIARALLVADMPFLSFQVSAEEALRNAGRLMTEGGAHAVKLEGGTHIAPTVLRLTEAGIPVMGHVGLTPQSVHQLGGYAVQAKEAEAARQLLDDCRALEAAGAFAVVLECIPAELAAIVSEQIGIPTIGIGAGAGCDGQVQVFHDLLGLGGAFTPRHAHRYAEIGELVEAAIGAYATEVRNGAFPTDEQCTRMAPEALDQLRSRLPGVRAGHGTGEG